MAGKYQAYPEYKDCSFPLIESLPINWSEQKVKFQLSGCVAGGTPESGNELFWVESGEGTPWVSIADMTRSAIVTKTEKDVSHRGINSKGLKIIPKGSLLYSIFASLGKVAEAGEDLTTNQAILALIQKDTLHKEFFRYWLQSIERYLMYYSTSNTQNNLNAEKVGNLPLFVPSYFEQLAIGRFLDHETAKIDTLIDKQQQLIQLLKEKRQAVISHAVTKGLNPNAPMRDSGVEWFRELPFHWKVGRLGYFSKVTNGATPSRENMSFWEGGEIGWLNSSKVNDVNIIKADQFITPLALSQTSVQLVNKDDVVMAITGEGQTRGRVAICLIDATINQHLAAIKITDKSLFFKFLFYYLKSQYERIRFESSAGGSTRGAITCTDIAAFPLAVPSLSEQKSIVQYIVEKEEKLDFLIQLAASQVGLLQERRTALISAAVTGKIDVRHHASHPMGDLQSSKSTVHGDL